MENYPIMLPNTSLPNLPTGFSFSVNPGPLWIIMLLALIISIIFSVILLYHWIRYSVGAGRMALTGIVYLLGTGALLSGMFIALSYYQLSVGLVQ